MRIDKEISVDVIVLGCGLAAHLQTRHLLRTIPGIRLVQIEAFGDLRCESCHFLVEMASLFLTQDLGLAEYLVDNHVPSSGINFHWPRDYTQTAKLEDHFSVWANREMPIQMWLINRPRLEADLAEMNLGNGVCQLFGNLGQIIPPRDGHPASVVVEEDEQTTKVLARHLIDASGDSAILARQLGLLDSGASADFNVGRAILRVKGTRSDSFVNAADEICTTSRFHALHYFFGPGYWISLVPTQRNGGEAVITLLNYHDKVSPKQVNSESALLNFLRQHQKLVHDTVAEAIVCEFQYESQVGRRATTILSTDRWYLVGKAAYDLDLIYAYDGPTMALTIASATEAVRLDLAGVAGVSTTVAALNEFNLAYAASIRGILDRQAQHLEHPGAMSHRITFEWLWWFGIHIPMFLGKWFLDPTFARKFASSVQQHTTGILPAVYDDLSRTIRDDIPLDLFDAYRCDQLGRGHGTPQAFDRYLENSKLARRRCNVFRGMRCTILHALAWYVGLRWRAFGVISLLHWRTAWLAAGMLSAAARLWIAELVFRWRTRHLPANRAVERMRQEVRKQHPQARVSAGGQGVVHPDSTGATPYASSEMDVICNPGDGMASELLRP